MDPELVSKCAAAEARVSELEAHNAALAAQVTDLLAQLDALRASGGAAGADLAAALARVKALEQELADTKAALDAAVAADAAGLAAELAALRERIEELLGEARRMTVVQDRTSRQLEEAQKVAQDLSTKNGLLSHQVGELKAMLSNAVKSMEHVPEKAFAKKGGLDLKALRNTVHQYHDFEAKEAKKAALRSRLKSKTRNLAMLAGSKDASRASTPFAAAAAVQAAEEPPQQVKAPPPMPALNFRFAPPRHPPAPFSFKKITLPKN